MHLFSSADFLKIFVVTQIIVFKLQAICETLIRLLHSEQEFGLGQHFCS